MQANEINARELSLYATNDGDLYRQRAQPIISNLARKMVKGVYDPALALKLWAYLANDAAKAYGCEFGATIFTKADRELAAREIADHYADELRDHAAELAKDRENRRTWTLAAIKVANEDAGRYFFSRDTMRAFGDTMASFGVRCDGGRIFVVRTRPMRDRDGRSMGGVGDTREFHPETGEVGVKL